MVRVIGALLCALILGGSSLAAEEEHLVWLRFEALQADQLAYLQTAHETYRVRLLHPETGEAQVARAVDGRHFGKPERVFLVGATTAPQPGDGGFGVVLMGELHEGMCLEWGWGSLDPANRRTTAPLTSIILDTPSATAPRK